MSITRFLLAAFLLVGCSANQPLNYREEVAGAALKYEAAKQALKRETIFSPSERAQLEKASETLSSIEAEVLSSSEISLKELKIKFSVAAAAYSVCEAIISSHWDELTPSTRALLLNLENDVEHLKVVREKLEANISEEKQKQQLLGLLIEFSSLVKALLPLLGV